MKMTRRDAIGVLAGAISALHGRTSFAAQTSPQTQISPGPFQPTTKSLSAYQVPDWFRDAKFGIKKDVVGMWAKAAREHGLKFGVSDHLWISYKWFATSHLADKSGPQTGLPYDGADRKYESLYHKIDDPKLLTAKLDWNENG